MAAARRSPYIDQDGSQGCCCKSTSSNQEPVSKTHGIDCADHARGRKRLNSTYDVKALPGNRCNGLDCLDARTPRKQIKNQKQSFLPATCCQAAIISRHGQMGCSLLIAYLGPASGSAALAAASPSVGAAEVFVGMVPATSHACSWLDTAAGFGAAVAAWPPRLATCKASGGFISAARLLQAAAGD